MSDLDTIMQAYEDTLKQVYSALFNAYTVTNDPNEQKQAEQRYITGIKLARLVRDRALALLP
jgi:hypothetical protein